MKKVGENREIKFEKQLRYNRQKDYDINEYETEEYQFKDAGQKKVYKNFNFSIFIDDICNADCKFCVAQLRYEHRKLLFKKCHIKNKKEYLRRLEEVLKVVRPLNPSISITGGEPTISPILTDVLKLVDKYNFRKRTITTNGSGLFNIQDNDTVLNNLIKYNWNHLNISRVSADDKINKKIMRYEKDSEYCSMKDLQKILEITNKSNLKHRISCLLLKESVNSVEKIKEYVDELNKIGANNFIFRELMDYDHKAVNKEKIEYCDKNKVKLNDIWEDFEKYEELKPYLNILGYYYYVEIYKYKDCTIASESANLNQQYIEKEKNKDIVYEMVFHTNGNLCGGWIDNEEILDKYEQDM